MKKNKLFQIGWIYAINIVLLYIFIIISLINLYTFMDGLLWEDPDFDLYFNLENSFRLIGIAGMVSFGLIILSLIFIFLMRLKLARIVGFLTIASQLIYLVIHLNMIFNIVSNEYYFNFLSFLVSVFLFFPVIGVQFLLIKVKITIEDISIVKKAILNLSTKFTRLQVREIAERTKIDKDTIIRTIKSMITRKEIHAQYFESSKEVSFDKDANISELDKFSRSIEQAYGKKSEKIE